MTKYEQGFLTKCAEYGVPDQMAMRMLRSRAPGIRKSAQFTVNPYMAGGIGALAGGGIGLLIEAMRKKKKDEKSHYLRNFLLGAGILGAGGAGAAMTNNAIARRDFALVDRERYIDYLRNAYRDIYERYNKVAPKEEVPSKTSIQEDPVSALAPQRAKIQAAETPEERASVEQSVATNPVVREALQDGNLAGGDYADALNLTDYDGDVRNRNDMGLGGYFASQAGWSGGN